ncbi:D-3-phosphoglycerate dehydrogenase [Algimonas arctica]|uniref:D-3-phosphoglycerate dehydrogenase n=1 Tax=Algimonas arctica TaxID=1479486 RepID=A0A8J3FZD9_9PROT|nr:phosphoglycerate dehydrogenase [Algimonas arctica]GHA81461.1 D-3-phosphoglycerate dehydrogenase [Algimonas arctica]
MPKVLIADKMSNRAVEVFKARGVDVDVITGLSKDELMKIIGEYDGLAVRSSTRPDAEIIGQATNLKVIGRAGIGVDNVDIKSATDRGVVVMNTPFGNAITTAEHAIAMLFAAARQIPKASERTQNGEWPKSDYKGTELFNKTLGVIGCGNIGALVAERALGLKMKVIAFDPYLTEERARKIGVEKVELDTLFQRADAITLHTPLVESTKNIVNRERLGMTRKGLILVNCARGGLVDEEALKDALDAGHVSAAALDVFSIEPAKEHALFGTPGFIATPHLGASTNEAQENVAVQVAEQMADYLLTGAISNAINTPSITAEEAPRLKPWVDLADKLGTMMGQLLHEPAKSIQITYKGGITQLNTNPLSAAALAGMLKAAMPDVNMVSAPVLAKERGIELTESYVNEAERADSLIRITVETAVRKFAIVGTIYRGEPRIVRLFGVPMDAAFSPSMIYVRNDDKPGFIGEVGRVLGEAKTNIATFSLGRKKEGGEAVCLISVDGMVSDATVAAIQAIDQVKIVDRVTL